MPSLSLLGSTVSGKGGRGGLAVSPIALKADPPLMPAIAHMICQGCGTHSEGLAYSSGSSADRCQCGGVRQVVRIVRHAGGETSPSVEELERSVQDRSRDETLTPTRKEH
jgi:hypothetical protein